MNGKILAIHQPNYIPWLGFFSKIKNADAYIILDNVKYTKNSVVNRNKIRTKEGWCYLTIPIEKVYYALKICKISLPKDKQKLNTDIAVMSDAKTKKSIATTKIKAKAIASVML